MKKKLGSFLFSALALFLALPSLALGGDYYVDAVNGSNANAGTSPGAAWKTMTFAMTAIPAGAHTLHAAAGTYDAASGEVFPILYKADLKLVSDAGLANTIVDATGATAAFRLESSVANPVSYHHLQTEIRGFTIAGGQYGIEMQGSVLQTILAVWNSTITGASVAGIKVERIGGSMGINVFESSLIGNGIGLLFDIGAGTGPALGGGINVSNSTVRQNIGDGIQIITTFGDTHCLVQRSRIEANGGDGFHYVGMQASNQFMTTSSSFSGNGGDGIREELFWPTLKLLVTMSGCTVAHNAGTGLSTTDPNVSSSILWGNALDLAGVNDQVNSSDIGTGIALGSGNLSVDPLFVNPAGLDFRLALTSPCIDAGSIFGSGADIDGGLRFVDSDLDTKRRHDMGAHERQTLRLAGTPAIGATPNLEIFGETGSTSIVLLSAFPSITAGVPTPYGQLFLHPAQPMIVLPPIPAGPGPLGILPIPIPPNPSFIGATVYFQAVTSSSQSLIMGAAFSNRVTLTVQSP